MSIIHKREVPQENFRKSYKSLKVLKLQANYKSRIKTPTYHARNYILKIFYEYQRYVYAKYVLMMCEASNDVLDNVKFFESKFVNPVYALHIYVAVSSPAVGHLLKTKAWKLQKLNNILHSPIDWIIGPTVRCFKWNGLFF